MINKLKYTTLSLLIIFAYSAAHAVINGVNVTVTASTLCNNGTIEKNFVGGCPGAWSEGALPVVDTSPVLFFSDLDSGPDSGWSAAEPNRGVAVTIWGRNLGASRGSSYVTVNGVNLDSAADYPDTWGEYNDPVPHLQRVTFHLKSTMTDGAGTISVTTSEGTSNTLPFTIRSGRILFVDVTATSGSGTITDPLAPAQVFQQEQIGDTYYFRGGSYDQQYEGGYENYYITADTAGTAANPIALVGYPSETALFDSVTNGNINSFYGGFSSVPDHYVISRLHINSLNRGIRHNSYTRIVGNDLEGLTQYTSGAALIETLGDGSKILGNSVHGGRTANRLDHGIYVQGCADYEGNEVAHNYLYDNEFGSGPIVQVNHQGDRCNSSQSVKSHYLHSNIIDCTNYGSRGIGIYDLSWDAGTETEPEPTYVYNNVLESCGGGSDTMVYKPAMYTNAAHTKWFNNTLLNVRTEMGFHADGDRMLTTEFRNNIVEMTSATGRHVIWRTNSSDTFTATNNLYSGGDLSSTNTAGGVLTLGTDYVNAASQTSLTIAPSFNFSLPSNSPALGQGVATPAVTSDFYKATTETPPSIGATQRVQ